MGGGLSLGILLFLFGIVLNVATPILIGIALVFAAFPFSLTFTNESALGRKVFGSIAAFSLITGIGSALFTQLNREHDPALSVFSLALIGCVACTWLGNVPALRR